MALYSFESPNSYLKLRDKAIVVDTSYLFRLTDKSDYRHKSVLAFHEKETLIVMLQRKNKQPK
jgi:hypothetical protein